jgi:prolyl-tRNA editing enzyme YbaK/EbsC (Cys-tRNA(Pro) deacylase)
VNHTVRRLVGVRKLSFAGADETVEATGVIPGGVTPFALPPAIPIYLEAPVRDLDEIILGGGGRATKVEVAPNVLELLPNVTIVEGLSID